MFSWLHHIVPTSYSKIVSLTLQMADTNVMACHLVKLFINGIHTLSCASGGRHFLKRLKCFAWHLVVLHRVLLWIKDPLEDYATPYFHPLSKTQMHVSDRFTDIPALVQLHERVIEMTCSFIPCDRRSTSQDQGYSDDCIHETCWVGETSITDRINGNPEPQMTSHQMRKRGK